MGSGRPAHHAPELGRALLAHLRRTLGRNELGWAEPPRRISGIRVAPP